MDEQRAGPNLSVGANTADLMTIIGGAGGLAVEQLPIEQIHPGDYVVANDNDGKPYVYQVHVKSLETDKQAGTSMVKFQGEPKPGVALRSTPLSEPEIQNARLERLD